MKFAMAGVVACIVAIMMMPIAAAGAAGGGAGISISPANGSTVSGEVNVVATPVDASAVSQIYFYLDSTFEGTSLKAPYGFSFNASSLPPGNHVIKAYMSYSLGSLEVDSDITTATSTPAAATAPPTTSSTETTTSVASPPAPAPTPAPATDPATTTAAQPLIASTQPFVGLDAYELATDYGVNDGCGADIHTSTDAFFASLPRGTVVRFWAFQAFGTAGTGAADRDTLTWGPLDNVFSAAAQSQSYRS